MSRPGKFEQLPLWPAERVCRLLTDLDEAKLNEPWVVEAEPGAWVVGHWSLIPKLGADGWWFPHWWCGPGTRRWRGSDGDIPGDAARFPTISAAAEALAGDEAAAYRYPGVSPAAVSDPLRGQSITSASVGEYKDRDQPRER